MNSALPLLPALALLVGAIAAAGIEVLGAPAGSRKVIVRTHLPWLVGAACAAAAWGARRVRHAPAPGFSWASPGRCSVSCGNGIRQPCFVHDATNRLCSSRSRSR